MKYLFDTDTLIDFLEDRDETRPQVNAIISAGDEAALCPITIAALYSGLSEKKRQMGKLAHCLTYWQICRQAARQAGIYRKTASDAGRPFSISDSLVAALAREQQATVLTSNIKDFPPEGIHVLSLRKVAT